MRKPLLLWTCLSLLMGAMAQKTEPQNGWHHNLYMEVGPKIVTHLSPDLKPFRPEGGYGSSINVDSWASNLQASARYEIVTPDYHWALRTGIQYSVHQKSIGYDADYIDDAWYYFEIANAPQLEYLRVKGIKQNSHYLGIPLELRYYFKSTLNTFRMYAMAETDFDFLIGNTDKVYFYDPEMEPYQSQVFSHYADPDKLNASTYLGGGFQVGDLSGIGVGFNVLLHVADLTGSTGMLTTSPTWAGFKLQIELLIPLK